MQTGLQSYSIMWLIYKTHIIITFWVESENMLESMMSCVEKKIIKHWNYTHFVTLISLVAVLPVTKDRDILWVTRVLMNMKKMRKWWDRGNWFIICTPGGLVSKAAIDTDGVWLLWLTKYLEMFRHMKESIVLPCQGQTILMIILELHQSIQTLLSTGFTNFICGAIYLRITWSTYEKITASPTSRKGHFSGISICR